MDTNLEFIIPEIKKDKNFTLVYWNTMDAESLMEDFILTNMEDCLYLTFYNGGLMFSLIQDFEYVLRTLKRHYKKEVNEEDCNYLLPNKVEN